MSIDSQMIARKLAELLKYLQITNFLLQLNLVTFISMCFKHFT